MPFVEADIIKFYPSSGHTSLKWMIFVEADIILWHCDDTTIHLGWPHKSWDLQRPVVSSMAKGRLHHVHLHHLLPLLHLLLPVFLGEADACQTAPETGKSWCTPKFSKRDARSLQVVSKHTSYFIHRKVLYTPLVPEIQSQSRPSVHL